MLLVEICVSIWALFQWKHSPIQIQILILFLVAATVIAVIESVMSFKNIHNLWVSHISTLMEYALLMSMYYMWKPRMINTHIIMIAIVAFFILWLVSKFTFESFNFLDTYTSTLAKITEIIVSALVLFDVLQDTNVELKTDARLWISSGVIIYSSGTLFLFALFNMMLDTSPDLIRTLWPINWILCIVFTLLLARGVWCKTAR